MTEPAAWDYDPVPVAARDARIREVLLAYCQDDPAPLLHLVGDISANRDLVAEALMALCKIYRADTYASMGRDLTVARLAADLQIDRGDAIGEAP